MDWLTTYLWEVLLLYGEMAPYLVVGFVLAGLLHAFIPKKAVVKHLGKDSVSSAIKGAVLGVPMPLCSCGVVPTAIGLRKRGASRSATVAFLIATPQTGLDSMAVTYGFFGWTMAVFCAVSTFISGIVGGISVLLFGKKQAVEEKWEQDYIAKEDALVGEPKSKTFFEKLAGGMRFAFIELLGDIAFWLVIGLFIAGVISLAMPDDFLSGKLGTGLSGMLIMLAFGMPLYVCSSASVPIAAVLMTKGVSAGAAFVFLMTGPATNAATMMIIARVMGMRILLLYLGTLAILALSFGGLLDYLLGTTSLTITPVTLHDHGTISWVAWASMIFLSALILRHFVKSNMRRFSKNKSATADLTLEIEGMTCSHCVKTVSDSLKNVRGVDNVTITLENGRAEISGTDLEQNKLADAVRGVGYRVKGDEKKLVSLSSFQSSSKNESN